MRKHKLKLIHQLGNTDCGLACLTMLFNYYGYKTDLPTLASEIVVGRDGMSLVEMKNEVLSRGFDLKAYTFDLEKVEIYTSNVPFILCTSENHYLIAGGIRKGKIKIFDPNYGIYYLDGNEAVKAYRNVMIKVTPFKKNYLTNIKRVDFDLQIPLKKIIRFFSCTIILESLVLLSPFLINKIVDMISNRTKTPYQKLFIVLTIAGSIYFLVTGARKKIVISMQANVVEKIYNVLIHKIVRLNIDFFYAHSYGDLVNRLNNLNIINNLISTSVFTIVIDMITAAVCFLIIVKASIEIAVLIGMVTIVLSGIILGIGCILRRENNIFMMMQSKMQGVLFNNISNVEQVRSLGIEHLIENKIMYNNHEYISQYVKKESCNILLDSITSTVSWLLLPAIYLEGSYLVSIQKISLGQLTSIVSVAALFVRPFITLSIYYPQFNMCMEMFFRLKEIMLAKNKNKEGKIVLSDFEKLELINVTFSYSNSKMKSLNNINISVKKGDKIAIVGRSGSGKSTIAKIIVRLFDSYQGEVLINGIQCASIKNMNRMVSIVTQTPFIFNGTIRENIDVIGEFDDLYIQRILKIVSMYEEVEGFPLKSNTLVGENGQNISGGQKQRIAIARALLYSPDIIIFDEATSNLDPVTEYNIYTNIKKLKTTQIIITHRLNTIIDSDNIYVLNGGEIMEEGTHEKLMELKGYYAQTFSISL